MATNGLAPPQENQGVVRTPAAVIHTFAELRLLPIKVTRAYFEAGPKRILYTRHMNVEPDGSKTVGGWVAETAYVYEGAYIAPKAIVSGLAQVLSNSKLLGESSALGNAVVSERAVLRDRAVARDSAHVMGDAEMSGDAQATEGCFILDHSRVGERALVGGGAMVSGSSQVMGGAIVTDYAEVANSVVYGSAVVAAYSQILESEAFDRASIGERAFAGAPPSDDERPLLFRSKVSGSSKIRRRTWALACDYAGETAVYDGKLHVNEIVPKDRD